jgi:hypothetical protein
MTSARNFDRSMLPPPRVFYSREFRGLPRESSAGWVSLPCPFHSSGEKRGRPSKSLRVNLRQGHFKCMSCETHGGDVVAFLMMRDRLDFRRAAQSLGAWREGGLSERDKARIERERRSREDECQRLAELAEENRRQRVEVRNGLHTLEKIQRECARDLSQFRDCPDSPESETAWANLALLCDPIRQLDHDYRKLSAIEVYP